MSTEMCEQLALILEVNPGEIVASARVGKDPKNRIYWEKWVAVIAILSVGVYAFEPTIQAFPEFLAFTPLCIMRISIRSGCCVMFLLVTSHL
ncbi:MAG: hypothetical protein AAF756_22810, partial [Pseudomonadota bacterium]